MNIKELLDQLVAMGVFDSCRSKFGPTKTYLKKYAMCNGYADLSTCPVDVFSKPLNQVMSRINEDALRLLLQDHALRNYKNTISFFLRKSWENGLLVEPDALRTWKDTPCLTKTGQMHKLRPRTYKAPSTYTLTSDELTRAPKFARELDCYYKFSISPTRAKRSIHKRMLTAEGVIAGLRRYAGFLVHFGGVELHQLSFPLLLQKEHLENFVGSYIDRQREKLSQLDKERKKEDIAGVTPGVFKVLINLEVLAKHYLKDSKAFETIKDIEARLSHPESYKNKTENLITIQTLETVGKSWYPFQATRLKELTREGGGYLNRVRSEAEGNSSKPNGKRTGRRIAFWVMISLLLRFYARIPLRQRNIREMKLGQNLYKDNGVWLVQFRANQLKVARRGNKANELKYRIERNGDGFNELLEEYLNYWRPLLMKKHNKRMRTPEGQAWLSSLQTLTPNLCWYRPPDSGEDHKYVFVNLDGKPMTQGAIYNTVVRCIYRFTNKFVNPHLIRDIWATDYLRQSREETGNADIVGAAYMLGDTVQSVLKYYAHILEEGAQERPQRWLTRHLSAQNGESEVSVLKKKIAELEAKLAGKNRDR